MRLNLHLSGPHLPPLYGEKGVSSERGLQDDLCSKHAMLHRASSLSVSWTVCALIPLLDVIR